MPNHSFLSKGLHTLIPAQRPAKVKIPLLLSNVTESLTTKKNLKNAIHGRHGTNLLESLQEMENSKDPVLFMA